MHILWVISPLGPLSLSDVIFQTFSIIIVTCDIHLNLQTYILECITVTEKNKIYSPLKAVVHP